MIYIPKRRILKALLCGLSQSNENGSVPGPHNAPYTSFLPGYTFYKPDISSTNNGQFVNFRHGINNNYGAVTNYVQPWASCLYRFYELTNEPLAIIKHAHNGAGIVDNGSSYVNGIWQWNANSANVNGLPHYDIFLNNILIPAFQKAREARFELDPIALGTTCGETDSGDLFRATNFQNVFIETFERLKTDLAPYVDLRDTFRPLITRVHNNFTPGTRPYLSQIRQAQENIAAFYGVPFINADAYPVAADNTHYTIAAQETHGIDRANLLVSDFL